MFFGKDDNKESDAGGEAGVNSTVADSQAF